MPPVAHQNLQVFGIHDTVAERPRGKPEKAPVPNPADTATDVLRDGVLGWRPGIYADKHDVYFGTVFDDLNEADRTNPLGVLVSQDQDAATYDPAGLLEFGQTYYWRIDEVNAPPDSTIFKSDIWSFTAEVLPDNKPMLAVLRKSDCKLRSKLEDRLYSIKLDFPQ